MIVTIEILLDNKVYTYIEDHKDKTFHLLYYNNFKLITHQIQGEQEKYDIMQMVSKIHYGEKER